jgi:hypothetical protein
MAAIFACGNFLKFGKSRPSDNCPRGTFLSAGHYLSRRTRLRR